MVQHSPLDPAATAVRAQIRECFGRVVYTTKTHEKAADLCVSRFSRAKLAQIVLSAFTTGGLVTAVFGDARVSRAAVMGSALVSTGLLILNAYMKNVDQGRQAERHRETAAQLWDIRESYLSLLTDLHDGLTDNDEVRQRRDQLQERLVAIYTSAPRTTAKAYGRASAGLKVHEELTFSDEEIDQFLPDALRVAVKGR